MAKRRAQRKKAKSLSPEMQSLLRLMAKDAQHPPAKVWARGGIFMIDDVDSHLNTMCKASDEDWPTWNDHQPLAMCFLAGFWELDQKSKSNMIVEKDGIISHRVPPPYHYEQLRWLEGAHAESGRKALVRILKSNLGKPLPRDLMHCLIAFFEYRDRKLKFISQSKHPHRTTKGLTVEQYIQDRQDQGISLADAKKEAAGFFGYESVRQIEKVRKKNRQRSSRK